MSEPPRSKNWESNLAALFVSQTLTMVAFSFVFPFFPLYIQTLGITDVNSAAQWAGLIISATAVSMAVASPIWGSLADRMGRRPMLIRSMAGGALTLTAMGFVKSVEQLLVLRFIQGGVTGTQAASNALAASTVPRNRLGFALGLMQISVFLGSSVGPLIGGVIADNWGFRTPFYAAGALMLVGLGLVLVFVHEDFVRPAAGVKRRGPLADVRALLGIPSLPMLTTVVFLIQLGGVIITPVLSLFISELNGGKDPGTAAGIVMAATGASSAVSALVLGRLGDRIGHSRVLLASLVWAALAYFPQGLVQDVWQLTGLRVLLGVALGGLMPSANALLAGLVPRERRGSVFGLTASATASANAVGPIAGAMIATYWGMRMVFVVTGTLYLLASAWVVVAQRRGDRVGERRVDVTGGRGDGETGGVRGREGGSAGGSEGETAVTPGAGL